MSIDTPRASGYSGSSEYAAKATSSPTDLFKERKTEYGREAHAESDIRGIEDGRTDGRADAFRHAFTSAKIARDYGPFASDVLGLLGELHGSAREGDYFGLAMDTFNNVVGSHVIGGFSYGLGLNDQQTGDLTEAFLNSGLLMEVQTNDSGEKSLALTGPQQGSDASKPSGQPSRIERPGIGDRPRRDLPADIRFDRWDRGPPDTMTA